jgi:threonine dehydratase
MASGPTAADVRAAALRMKGKIHRTPLLESLALNNVCGARVLVKAECLQKVSFL